MLLYSLAVLWLVQHGHRDYQQTFRPWYRHKQRPSFRDMLITLRRTSIREQVSALGLSGPGSKQVIQTLENAVSLAA